jgi:hypothetical protein
MTLTPQILMIRATTIRRGDERPLDKYGFVLNDKKEFGNWTLQGETSNLTKNQNQFTRNWRPHGKLFKGNVSLHTSNGPLGGGYHV